MAWVDGKWIDEEDSAAKNLTGLLDQNSDYIKQARHQGVAAAGKRGLLNSSIAAGSGQSSAIAAALPIASQDANTAAAKNAAAAGLDYQKQLNAQTGQQQIELAGINNQAESERQKVQQQAQLELQAKGDVAAAERLKEQLAQADRSALLQAETNLQQTKIQSSDNLTAAYLQAIGSMGTNSKMKSSDRNAYIAEMQRVTGQTSNLNKAVSGVTLSW